MSGRASESRKLFQIFSVEITYVIKDSMVEVWQLVLRLRQLSSFDCAPSLSLNEIGFLKMLINKCLQPRLKCFLDIELRPNGKVLSTKAFINIAS